MGAPAEVRPASLAIKADLLVRRNGRNDLGLVAFTKVGEELHGSIPGHHSPFHGQIGRDDFPHPGLNGDHVFRREGPLEGEIVVKAVLNHGPNGDLGLRKQGLDRLGQQVGGGMPEHLQAGWVLRRHYRELRVLLDQMARIHQLIVDPPGQGGTGEAGANSCGDLSHRNGAVKYSLAAIWQSDDGHGCCTLMVGASGVEPPTPSMSRKCSNH